MSLLRADAVRIWKHGVAAAHAGKLVREAVRVDGRGLQVKGRRIPLETGARVVVIGAGKAGGVMAAALEDVLGASFLSGHAVRGWVNVPAPDAARRLRRIVLHPARRSHENRPTREALAGSDRMLAMAGELWPADLVLVLLSGGGSALWPAPAPGLSLADEQRATDLLLASGADITEMNTVRKHLSSVKGGGLVRATRARVLALIVSDVVGDPLDAIASGPTAPDPTTFQDALAVLARHGLENRVPRAVREHLHRGARGLVPETLKRPSSRVTNVVIGSNATARRAAAAEARALGYRVLDLSSRLEGESRELGVVLAGLARGVREDGVPVSPPACLLSGGETTVRLGEEPGKGGRNLELALGALAHLGPEGLGETVILSGGTDGEDGPTDAAGGIATAAVAVEAGQKGLEPAAYLVRHDAYSFFARAGGLLKTGPTGTNVMDLRVVLVGPRPGPKKRRGRGRAAKPR